MLQMIKDYETPPQKEFSRGLEAELQPSVAFLDRCRPLSVSMTNALRHLTWQLTQLPNSVSDSEVILYLYMYCCYDETVVFIAFTTREIGHTYMW
jgi:translation initiation factor eIF-2B subunit delta